MAMENFTRHQQSIIKRYYEHRDTIALQKAQEQVTELYLSEGKKRAKVWEALAKNLEKIGVAPEQIARLQKEDKPELVAKIIETKL